MKGDPKVIDTLNDLLADELTAINQYMVHAEMCDNWGYKRLEKTIEARAITEMRHAEKIIARILFLEGTPTVSNLKAIHIGPDVQAQLKHDWDAEAGAIASYNKAANLTADLDDYGTHKFLEAILADEEDHIDWIEAQLDQISQMGIQTYLTEQLD
jgi:bacterioferritin